MRKIIKNKSEQQIEEILRGGGIGVIPSDTIYGIVGSALIPKTVEKIYELRKRSKNKPMIILISSLADLKLFNITLTRSQKTFLEKNWPNPLSVVLHCPDENLSYLHRGQKSLAFRMPKDRWLLELLKLTGPLSAPSANLEGEKSAKSIEQAKKYFGDKIDFYINGGKVVSHPSTLIKLYNHKIEILRQGGYDINE
ncbi:threonylcarbamoyl-AMP synthase [Candidatus Daviesbacteria bacterium]|nr:threonylcarbamoyl-AMP synthase [Candidatus Daviesbacteria bacterium]